MHQTGTLPALERSSNVAQGAAAPRVVVADDKAMLKAAANLTRDLNVPDRRIFWADIVGSAVLGYVALGIAMLVAAPWLMVAAGVVAVLALYRAGSFIHEVSHIKHSQLPGFRLGWNLLVGIPLLIPSFLYEGVHNMHHAKTRYGTVEDPEYLPLALMKPWTLPLFLIASALAPVALLFRFAVLTPLSLLSSRLRAVVVARYSGLQINPQFRRRSPEGEFRRQWAWQEAAASLWAIALIVLTATRVIPWHAAAVFLAVTSGTMFLNQVRTLVAHLWENDGEQMSVTAQYLDSVNVPPPATLPALWAPVGLRYHALHHLLPGVPYHNLAEAHRRLSAALDGESVFHSTNHRALSPLVGRLAASTWRAR
jgi:fatty acid desaturase